MILDLIALGSILIMLIVLWIWVLIRDREKALKRPQPPMLPKIRSTAEVEHDMVRDWLKKNNQ